VDLLQRGFTGIETRDDLLRFDPFLPDEVAQLHFRMRYRQHYGLEVSLRQGTLMVSGRRHVGEPLRIRVSGRTYEIDPGGALSVPLG
jgi:trehalose/maltose hydrolase-like predicted phosphorylase